jgi:transcription termination factor Rho
MAEKATTPKKVEGSKTSSRRPSSRPSNNNRSDDRNVKTIPVEGHLQVLQDYGVLRQDPANKTLNDVDMPNDVYVSPSQIKKLSLRKGDLVQGHARAPKPGERYLSLLQVDTVQGLTVEEARKRPFFCKTYTYFSKRKIKA